MENNQSSIINRQLKIIAIEKLIAHPANPNRMSKTNFNKLAAHIKSTGNYEPVIVRPHPSQQDSFEIINGHHRVKALRQLGQGSADCVVWAVDDAETMILLTTLNRLGGKDDYEKKAELIKALVEKYDSRALAKLLPDTKKTIEVLACRTIPTIDIKAAAKTF